MNSLQAELEQILQDKTVIKDHEFGFDLDFTEALQAILATVSKHLPENNVFGEQTILTPSELRGYHAAIDDMEKILGGNV